MKTMASEEVKWILDMMCKRDARTDAERDAVNYAIRAISERDAAVSALESQRWIPVTERLPAPGERVLCFVKAIGIVNNIHCDAMTVDYIGSNGGWIPVDEGYEFTHWMPLPPIPKEER